MTGPSAIYPTLLKALVAAPGGLVADQIKIRGGFTDLQMKGGLRRMVEERMAFTLKFGRNSVYFATPDARDAAAPAWAQTHAANLERTLVSHRKNTADRHHQKLADERIASAKHAAPEPTLRIYGSRRGWGADDPAHITESTVYTTHTPSVWMHTPIPPARDYGPSCAEQHAQRMALIDGRRDAPVAPRRAPRVSAAACELEFAT